jgi:alpha-beta hydrolase superfamily lysophospholipase
MHMIIRDTVVNSIPVLEMRPDTSPNDSPVLVILHGFNGTKEKELPTGYRFAKRGYTVVLFDAHLHGESETHAFSEHERIAQLGKTLEIWTVTCQRTMALIEQYRRQDSHRRIGLLGKSMGGFVVFQYLSKKPKPTIDAAVCLISTPSWVSLFEMSNARYPGMTCYFSEDYLAEARAAQPINFLEHFEEVPLLILNGQEERKFSIDDLPNVVDRLRGVYTDTSHVRSIVYEGIGHEVTPMMLREAEEWFQVFLKGESA